MLDPIQIQAYKIPREHREHLLSLNLPEWFKTILSLPQDHPYTKYLFELYDEYIYRDTEQITCSQCRSRVMNKFQRIIETYQQYGIERP
jgi:hypothetical protein